MTMTGLEADTQAAYRNFATREARGNSSLYERVCLLITDDVDLLAQIDALPAAKRQPNLVLGAARYLGAPEASADAFVDFVRERWGEVVPVVMARMTQTNEVGRCATLVPFVAEFASRFDAPIALVEVGCSAGLALYPDLYSYRYATQDDVSKDDVGHDGVNGEDARGVVSVPKERTLSGVAGAPELTCRVENCDAWREVDTTQATPRIAWRGGLDLNPLDVVADTDEARDNARWLDALVWPGQDERRHRLSAAIATARDAVAKEGAPVVVAGDVVDDIDTLLDQVPADLPLVVFHSAVLAYNDAATREAFEAKMAALATRPAGFTWISNEAAAVMPGVAHHLAALASERSEPLDTIGRFVLAVGGHPRALTGPHGQSLYSLAVSSGS